MRVLHVNSELTWRGGERQVELLSQYSTKQVQSSIACHPEGELHRRLSGNHKLVSLSIRNGFDLKAAIKLKQLAQYMDLIHCHTPKAQSVAILAKILGCKKPVICTKRTSFSIGDNYFSKLKYRKTDQVVCVSLAAADVLQKQLPELDINVIHSAIEKSDPSDPIDLNTLIPETKNKKVIGYVAAITEEKNPQGFLKTVQSVIAKKKDCCFLWIGDGALENQVQSEIAEKGLSGHVFLPGFQVNIRSWIAALDLLFFPSLSEGFPTTLLQTMQSSVPVIASDLPGIREIITNGQNGLLCKPDDFDGFANAIVEVLSDKEQSKSLVQNGLKSCEGFYAEKMAEKYIDLYRKMITHEPQTNA